MFPQTNDNKHTWQKIPDYADYGSAVFQLKELSGNPHPMAFEFKTRSESIFFPTVHIHDGQVHSHEQFDHSLFMQHAGCDSMCEKYKDRVDETGWPWVVTNPRLPQTRTCAH